MEIPSIFKHKKTVVYILEKKILAANVSDEPARIESLTEFEYTPETLAEIFVQIKKKLAATNVRIVIGEEHAFVVSVQIGKNESYDRDLVQEKIQELVPLQLDNTVWDFKEVAVTDATKILQAFVVEREYYNRLVEAAEKANLPVVAIEPVSFTLARLTKDEDVPHLILFKNTKGLIIFAHHGVVLATELLDLPINSDQIKKFINFAQDRLRFYPQKVIVSGDWEEADWQKLNIEEIEVEQRQLNPMVGIAKKTDIRGEDEKVLNLEPLKVKKETVTPEDQIVQKKEEEESPVSFMVKAEERWLLGIKKRYFLLYISAMAIALLVIGGGFSFYRTKTQAPAKVEESLTLTPIVREQESTQNPTPSATPTPIIAWEEYRVQVLNGSGVSGAASKMVDLLKDLGFKHFKIGNAESFNYTDTVLRRKGSVPESVVDKIEETLSGYNVVEASQLADEAEFDIVIIVGSKSQE